MSKKIFIIAAAMVITVGGLLYQFIQRDNESVDSDVVVLSQPIIKWQEITITEFNQNIAMHIHAPRIIISNNYRVGSEVNRAIARRIESLRDDFISAVSTAAEDNGETNILNVETEVLLATPKLISFAFITTEHLAGVNNNDTERTFIIFDLVKSELMVEGNELFRDDVAWSRAAEMMKNHLLAGYQGDPSCDLLFAPQHNGFTASCIGVDWSRGGKHLSITGDISMSMIQEFLAPSVLSDIIQ